MLSSANVPRNFLNANKLAFMQCWDSVTTLTIERLLRGRFTFQSLIVRCLPRQQQVCCDAYAGIGNRLMDNSVRSEQVNVIALVRGEEHYVFVFDPKRRTELLRLLGRYAADPSMSFNWYDAAVLSQKIRELMPATELIDTSATKAAPSTERSRRF